MLSSLRIRGTDTGIFFCSLMSVSEAYLLTQFDTIYFSVYGTLWYGSPGTVPFGILFNVCEVF